MLDVSENPFHNTCMFEELDVAPPSSRRLNSEITSIRAVGSSCSGILPVEKFRGEGYFFLSFFLSFLMFQQKYTRRVFISERSF